MINRIDIRKLDFRQDEIGAWYYTLDDIPYTGCAYQTFPNNNLASEGNFVNGYQDGIQRYWYENGQLKSEENFSNNIQHGRCSSWYVNGVLCYECDCNMGDTIWSKRYNEQGELVKQYP